MSQDRKSISIRGTTYDKIREYCNENGVTISEFMDRLLLGFFVETPGSITDKPESPSSPLDWRRVEF